MSTRIIHVGLAVVVCFAVEWRVLAQSEVGAGQSAIQTEQPVKPTGPAAKKADALIQSYTARIEREIDQGQKEVERLRAELHELIDVRDEMAKAIAELRADLAAKGIYSADAVMTDPSPVPATTQSSPARGNSFRRDIIKGLGAALPKNPGSEEREQLRRLAPRAEVKRMILRLRAEVEKARAETDEMTYKLLELRAGIPVSAQGMGGGMGGSPGVWFGSLGTQGGMM